MIVMTNHCNLMWSENKIRVTRLWAVGVNNFFQTRPHLVAVLPSKNFYMWHVYLLVIARSQWSFLMVSRHAIIVYWNWKFPLYVCVLVCCPESITSTQCTQSTLFLGYKRIIVSKCGLSAIKATRQEQSSETQVIYLKQKLQT